METDVSYAPTEAFVKAFPEEVAAQARKFTKPSWQTRIEQAPGEEMRRSGEDHMTKASTLPTEPIVLVKDDITYALLIGGAFVIGFVAAHWFFSAQ